MFESVNNKLSEVTNELFELEKEIEESINKHGSENYAEYNEKYGGNQKKMLFWTMLKEKVGNNIKSPS